MKKDRMAAFFMISLFIVSAIPGQEKVTSRQAVTIDEYRSMLKSRDFKERKEAIEFFGRLSKKEIGESLLNEIVDYFVEETTRFKKANKAKGIDIYTPPYELFPNDKEGEGYAHYIVSLYKIAGESGSKKALSLLIEYYAPPKFLGRFGEEAVEPYLEALNKPANTPEMNSCYINVLGYWLLNKKNGYNPSGLMREKIKGELIKRAFSKAYRERASALMALINASDEDLLIVFDKIAKNDPGHVEEGIVGVTDQEPAPGKKILRYPLRELAKGAIEKRRKK